MNANIKCPYCGKSHYLDVTRCVQGFIRPKHLCTNCGKEFQIIAEVLIDPKEILDFAAQNKTNK